MSFRAPSATDLAALLTTYCSACVLAAREPPRGDEASLHATATSAAIMAWERGFSTEEFFLAFETAWDKDRSWGALPHSLQSAAYDRALTLLTDRFPGLG